jgi:hypothetical protein
LFIVFKFIYDYVFLFIGSHNNQFQVFGTNSTTLAGTPYMVSAVAIYRDPTGWIC